MDENTPVPTTNKTPSPIATTQWLLDCFESYLSEPVDAEYNCGYVRSLIQLVEETNVLETATDSGREKVLDAVATIKQQIDDHNSARCLAGEPDEEIAGQAEKDVILRADIRRYMNELQEASVPIPMRMWNAMAPEPTPGEKIVLRIIIDSIAARQRGILWAQVGDEDWEATPEEKAKISRMIEEADHDPVGPDVVTRNSTSPRARLDHLTATVDKFSSAVIATGAVINTMGAVIKDLKVEQALLRSKTNIALAFSLLVAIVTLLRH